MVEGGAAEASENDFIDALMFAHEPAQPILELIEKLRAAVGKPKREFDAEDAPRRRSKARVAALVDERSSAGHRASPTRRRATTATRRSKKKLAETLTAELGAEKCARAREAHQGRVRGAQGPRRPRATCSTRGKRIDGRDTQDDPPDHDARSGLLPRVHGSALFQRGETQAIVTTTLGTSTDEQKIDALTGERWKRFLLHYNFPPLLDGRDQADARPRPSRDRPRRPRRARARSA